MELIPRIALKNHNIINENITVENISNFIKEGDQLYVIDYDGIEKNRTNIDFFQKLSSTYDLWIDCGPRNIGDVVDIFMMGANSITIRKNKYPKLNIPDIRDISENKVYLDVDLKEFMYDDQDFLLFKDFDGLVNSDSKEEIEQNIEFKDYVGKIKMQNKVYFYENNIKNYQFWEGLGADGLIIDINRLKEFRDGIRA